jgi:hypothetical protein
MRRLGDEEIRHTSAGLTPRTLLHLLFSFVAHLYLLIWKRGLMLELMINKGNRQKGKAISISAVLPNLSRKICV